MEPCSTSVIVKYVADDVNINKLTSLKLKEYLNYNLSRNINVKEPSTKYHYKFARYI